MAALTSVRSVRVPGLLGRWVIGLGLALGTAGSLSACSRSEAPPSLPVLGAVGEVVLTDQYQRPVTEATLAGHPWVASFFFTRCPTVCPKLMAALRELRQDAKTRGLDVRLLSITVDPEHDTSEVLRAYGEAKGVGGEDWLFLTGDAAAIRDLSVNRFKMALEGMADVGKEDLGILHGTHLALVDASGQVRGFYAASDADARARLLQDLAGLDRPSGRLGAPRAL